MKQIELTMRVLLCPHALHNSHVNEDSHGSNPQSCWECPQVSDKGCPLEGGLSSYTENLTVDHSKVTCLEGAL